MKCPKCGFTSFDYLENCKKCGKDLQEFKVRHGMRSILFPGLSGLARPALDDLPVADTTEGLVRTATDFGFDFMAGEANEVQAGPDLAPGADGENPAVPDLFDLAVDEEDTAFQTTPALDELVLPEEGVEPESDADRELIPENLRPQGLQDRVDLTESPDFGFGGGDGELPPLELEPAPAFAREAVEPSALETEEIFLDWDDLDQETDSAPNKKPADLENPPDPFDHRGFAAAGRTPVAAELPVAAAPGTADPAMDRLLASFDSGWDDSSGESEVQAEPVLIQADPPLGEVLSGFPPETGSDLAPSQPTTTEPVADTAQPADDDAGEEALPGPLVARLAASIADLLLLAAVFLLFLVLGQWLMHPDGADGLLPPTTTLLRLSTPYFLILFTISFGYFTFFHFLLGQTPGKMLFGLGVESLRGVPLTLSQSFLRSAGGLASLCLAGAGFAAALFDDEGRGWNDRLAGSRVVTWTDKERSAGPEEATG
jgi:uncharacterized RDD family membrane protein YckC